MLNLQGGHLAIISEAQSFMDTTQLFLRAQYCEPGIGKQRPIKGCIKMEFRGNNGNLEATSRVAPVRTQS